MKTKLSFFIALLNALIFFSSCQKELSFENLNTSGTTLGTANITFSGGPGTCLNQAINGNFEAGVAMDITNNITIPVNVTDTGSYIISSNSINGIQFTASGYFTSPGLQPIVLFASGTPASGGTFNLTFGNAGCSVAISFTGGVITPPGNSANCKTCSYLPLCVGSKYTYNDTTYGVASIRSIELLTTIDTTIGSRVYQKITASNGPGYYNCTNGETTVIGYALVSNNGNLLQKYQSIMLKANVAAGTLWSDTLTNPAGQTVILKSKIESKGISKTVGSFNFTDIIVVSVESGVDLPGIGFIAASLSYYYYAKTIGLVEVVSIDPFSGVTFYHSVVKSYFIP